MGRKVYFDTQELEVLSQVIEDDIDTSEAYQRELEQDTQGQLFDVDEIGESSLMTDAIVREEVLRRVKVKLEGGE